MDDITLALRGVKRTVTRPNLNIIFLLDVSGSMQGDGKITALNNLMRELPPSLKKHADDKKLQLVMRAITFGSHAQYVFGDTAKGVAIDNSYSWRDVECGLKTATASAISLASQCLEQQYLGKRNNTPIVFLITDGECTESDDMLNQAIEDINIKLGGRTIRVAIGIGDGCNLDELKKFASVGYVTDSFNQVVEKPYIYSITRREDMEKIIEDIASFMVLRSGVSGVLI